MIVTERGIAVNPLRPELEERMKSSRLPVVPIEKLRDEAYRISGKPEEPEFTDKIIGVVEYRDGTVIDVVRQIASGS